MSKRTHRFVDSPLRRATYTYKEFRAAAANEGRLCSWYGCPTFRDPDSPVPLCTSHYSLVINDWLKKAEAHKAATRAPLDSDNPVVGHVYYALIDGLVKIGYATDVTQRMRAYPPTARLLAVEPGTLHTESQRHDQFRAYLARGREWFRDVPELREWVEQVRAEHGNPRHLEHRWTGPRDTIPTVVRR